MSRIFFWSRAWICAAAMCAFTGCEPYAVRGKVIPGTRSSVELVAKDDPRLAQPGLADASVMAVLDPLRVSREHLGSDTTGPDGAFAIPVEKFGAGLLEYDLMVAAQAPEHVPAELIAPMPGSGKRFLITLAPGRQRSLQFSDPLRDTMRDAQPYLNQPSPRP